MSEFTFSWRMPYDQFLIEASEMIPDHWMEVGSFNDILPLDPDHDRYRRLEHAGALHILTARRNGRLAGYFFVLTMPYPRCKSATAGMDDLIYVAPEFRPDGLGFQLIEEAESELSRIGVNFLFFRHKAWRKGTEYMKRMGFEPLETVYVKTIRAPEIRT